MKFNLTIGMIALIVLGSVLAGYFGSMSISRWQTKRDTSEKEVDLTASNGVDETPVLPISPVLAEGEIISKAG